MGSFSRCSAAVLSAFVLQALVVGCSSSSSPASPDAGDDAVGADTGSSAEAGGGDSAAQTCEASTLPPPDAGGGCNACIKTSCMTELAACAADCVCGPIEACLELTDVNNYPGCPGAMSAIFSGEVPLMNIAGCAAMNCQGPCFTHDAGGN